MNIVKKLLGHELISNSVYIFIASMVGNVLAFLLNLFLARSLSYVDYGIFASLMSVIVLASIPGASINTILVRFATEYYSKGQIDKLKDFYKKALKFIFAFSLLVLLAFIIFSSLITTFLHLDNFWYVIVAGLCVVMGYIQILNSGFLYGIMKFRFVSFTIIFSSFVKLGVGVLLVLLGLRAFSGLGALLFMGLAAFLVAFIPLRFIFAKKIESEVKVPAKEILKYAFPVFITILFMTSFTSIDVILVKHFLSPTMAGYYSGISLIGKVILYFTATIPTVMFPLLIKRQAEGKNINNLFLLAVLLVLLPSLLITGVYFLFPHFIITLFLGGRGYLTMAPFLGLFGLFITLYSVVNIFVNFFLSINKTKIISLLVGAALLQIVLLWIYHSNFYQIISISIIVSALLLMGLILAFIKNHTNSIDTKKNAAFINTPTENSL
jgi:O-antigen/teichoic acid export membrane protein